jgi:hypothetical protein
LGRSPATLASNQLKSTSLSSEEQWLDDAVSAYRFSKLIQFRIIEDAAGLQSAGINKIYGDLICILCRSGGAFS